MKLSEVIARLEDAKQLWGDIPLQFVTSQGNAELLSEYPDQEKPTILYWDIGQDWE